MCYFRKTYLCLGLGIKGFFEGFGQDEGVLRNERRLWVSSWWGAAQYAHPNTTPRVLLKTI